MLSLRARLLKNADQVAAILFDPFGQKGSVPSDAFIGALKKACITLIFYSLPMRLFPSERDFLLSKRKRN